MLNQKLFNFKLETSNYLELHQFRQEKSLANQTMRHLYKHSTKISRLYKSIFLGITLLYCFLTLFLIHEPLYLHCFFFSLSSFVAKLGLSLFTGIVALISFAIFYTTYSESEAVRQLVSKALRKLKQKYKRKVIQAGFHPIFSFCCELGARQIYNEIKHEIKDLQQETLHLLEEIIKAPSLQFSQREELLTQALEELQSKLQTLLLRL